MVLILPMVLVAFNRRSPAPGSASVVEKTHMAHRAHIKPIRRIGRIGRTFHPHGANFPETVWGNEFSTREVQEIWDCSTRINPNEPDKPHLRWAPSRGQSQPRVPGRLPADECAPSDQSVQ
jgi:hypothetical protein